MTLLVLTMVVGAMVIRDAAQYSPESAARRWCNAGGSAAIILWFASGLLLEITTPHRPLPTFLLSRTFVRDILAIVLVWLVFRDEL
jgi:hypothetical protein